MALAAPGFRFTAVTLTRPMLGDLDADIRAGRLLGAPDAHRIRMQAHASVHMRTTVTMQLDKRIPVDWPATIDATAGVMHSVSYGAGH